MDNLTIKQAAKELNVSTKTIRRMIEKGTLSAKKISGKYVIPFDSIRSIGQAQDRQISGPLSTFDPVHHVVIKREEWESMLVRLGQLEAENKNYQKLLEDKRPWWKKIIRR